MAGSSCLLISNRVCSDLRRNSTTAFSKTSNGLKIAVTFCAAVPPALSEFVVYCPGIESSDVSLSPKVIIENYDLAVLRVPHPHDSRSIKPNRCSSDYFVYRLDPRRPSLYLLPNPYPETLGDDEIAILSCNGDDFVVAALQSFPCTKLTFKLHLYRSVDGNQGSWSSQLLSVEKPLRVKKFPMLDLNHLSSKVIIIGGDKGIVGWVDLWRGIVLCNVLSSNPQLLDMPLPSPPGDNLHNYRDHLPTYFRDITVNRTKDTIKYVEMEIAPPQEVFDIPMGHDTNWVLYSQCLPQYVIPGSWTATIYKMPISIGSVHKWEKVDTVHLGDLSLPVGNQSIHNVMDILLRTSDNNMKLEDTKATSLVGCLSMAYPTLSTGDDDVVYLLTKGTCMGSKGSMRGLVTVDMKEKTLQGLELLDTRRRFAFMPHFVASGMFCYRKTPGTKASLRHAEEDASADNSALKPAGMMNPPLTSVRTCPGASILIA